MAAAKPYKIAIVTCYSQSDYPRAVALRKAFGDQPNVAVTIIKNKHKGLLRFAEVGWKVLRARFSVRPDAYVITFRGYEMLLYFVLTLVRRPIIFDELINIEEWMYENGRLRPASRAARWCSRWYAWLLRRCRIILADTNEHARHSAELSGVPLERYRTIPVGTNESELRVEPSIKVNHKPFVVFYPNSMRPLHGMEYVLEAAVQLSGNHSIRFVFSGGKDRARAACQDACRQGAAVEFYDWIPFADMAAYSRAGLTLGGPFGNTTQAQYVITGKTYNCLAAALPVLVGKNKVKSSLKDKVNCLMVPQADTAALVKVIEWAATHPKELQIIGRAGQKLYQQEFSSAVIAHKVGDILRELRA